MILKMKQKSKKIQKVTRQKLTLIGKRNFYAEFQLNTSNEERLDISESELSHALIQAYTAGIESSLINCSAAY